MTHSQKIEIEFNTSGPTFRHGMAAIAHFQDQSHRVVPFVRSHGELVEPFSPWADDASSIVYQIEVSKSESANAKVLAEAMLSQLAAAGVTVRAA